MSAETPPSATVADLLKIDGKAELIAGRIFTFALLTVQEGRQVRKILRSLEQHVAEAGVGEACPPNVGFVLGEPLPSGRLSFCPEVAYLAESPKLDECGFVLGAPVFAVEFGQAPSDPLAPGYPVSKRTEDYFAAGTMVVWEVDGGDLSIACHRRGERKATYFPWDGLADAEPAIPGWRLAVKTLLPYPRA